jgi:heptosyltransferase-2
VGLAPGAAYGFAKQWPADRFGALARLLAQQGIWSVLIGRPADQDVGRQVMTAFEGSGTSISAEQPAGRIVNLIGRTDVRQLMGLMAHCATFVANDSGAAHLAAAVGLPVVAIFGPTDERISAPLPGQTFRGSHAILSHPVFCRPCMLRECPIDHRCMTRIDPCRVLDAVLQMLALPFKQ